MEKAEARVSEQNALWNGAAGHAWVESQEVLDQMLKPFEDLLVDATAREASRRVLDVGCGTGSTTVALARRLGPAAGCTGIDISAPMLDAARTRAQHVEDAPRFILGDAQTYAFEPGSFDAVVSRFGVMFFDDPRCAFENLRRAAELGARLRFVAWRSPDENPFMTTAERVAAPLLPGLPARRPDEPGQFGFADPTRVQRILRESGWSEIDIQAVDLRCSLPECSLMHYITRLGPVGRALQDADERVRARFIEDVRVALEPYVEGANVRYTSASWLVTARA